MDIRPHIIVRPIHNGIADPLRLQFAALEQKAGICIIVVDNDLFAEIVRHTLVNAAFGTAAGAFRPADTRRNHAASAAAFFQHRTAVSYCSCGRHQLLRYKHPHIDRYALVSRVIDSTFHTGELQTPELLAHVVYSLRCIHAGMVVHDLIADTGSGGKVQAYIAVFPATHCNNQWLTVIGFAHFRCQPQTGDCSMF